MSLNLFLQVLALVALALSAFNVPGPARINWLGLGMFLWMLTIVFGGLRL